jgi:hypothetical protein
VAPPDEVTQAGDDLLGEPRWPIALAVAVFIALTVTLRHVGPRRQSIGPSWLMPLVLVLLFLALVTADPHGDSRYVVWLRRCSIALIVLLAGAAVWSTGTLVHDLITGGKVTNSPGTLLAVGALIWAGNNLVFSLLYWEFDSGGARSRLLRTRKYPDFAFPQQLNPELAPPGWRPRYVDYFYLGLTNSTAFSPTDVMPMTAWAKLTMSAQSLVSLVIIGLVIARAVNIFT